MALTAKSARPLVHAEDLDAAIAELLAEARSMGAALRDVPGRLTLVTPKKPSIDALLHQSLRESLEDEIVPAVPTADGSIDEREVHREVLKKALVGLKLAGLRRVARQSGISASVGAEQLAERIARFYEWDEEEIARLVLENEEDVRPDRGFVTRIFPLKSVIEPERIERDLSYVAGRYIRIGVARWFVFDYAKHHDDGFHLSGALRAYAASVDDRDAMAPRLRAVTNEDRADLVISGNILQIKGTGSATARAAVQALVVATEIVPLGRIPFIEPSAPAIRGELHESSKFLIDILVNRFPRGGLDSINLTVARFRVGDEADEVSIDSDAVSRPLLRAVRFEGDHLLDSVPACRLLAIEQRPLTDVSMQITVRGGPDNYVVGRFPMRLALEREHVSVETSFGLGNQELSAEVHSQAVASVRAELDFGHADEARLETLARRMVERALSDAEPEEADMLVSTETLPTDGTRAD